MSFLKNMALKLGRSVKKDTVSAELSLELLKYSMEQEKEFTELKRKLINNGYARYNPTNGEFEVISPSLQHIDNTLSLMAINR